MSGFSFLADQAIFPYEFHFSELPEKPKNVPEYMAKGIICSYLLVKFRNESEIRMVSY